jgi:hypothetical protein
MQAGVEPVSGWMVSGFFAWVTLWVWSAVVLLYALWRSFSRPEPDPIRPSGPTGV